MPLTRWSEGRILYLNKSVCEVRKPCFCVENRRNTLIAAVILQVEQESATLKGHSGWQLAFQAPHHVSHTALAAHFFHHTLHLFMLFEQSVNILDLGARTLRDPALA
jgi:hypothetical protein